MRILIVGQDPALNHLRTRLLTPEYEVTCGQVEEAAGLISNAKVDALLICHTVSLQAAAELIQVVSEKQAEAKVLWLSEWQTQAGWTQEDGNIVSITQREQPWIQSLEEALSIKKGPHGDERPKPKHFDPVSRSGNGRTEASS